MLLAADRAAAYRLNHQCVLLAMEAGCMLENFENLASQDSKTCP